MQGIFVQLSRLGFLIILWWLIFRIIHTIRNDFTVEKTTKTKSRLPQIGSWKNTKAYSPKTLGIIPKTLPPSGGVSDAKFLCVTSGPQSGTTLTLGEEDISIGKSPQSTLIISDDYSSPHHARLTKSGTQWYIEDLGSTNGTYINQARISATTTIPINTPVRVGKTIFELQP